MLRKPPLAETYAVAPDGSRWVNLTRDLAQDQWPSWSPDGAKIAFVSDRGGEGGRFINQVYVSGIVLGGEQPEPRVVALLSLLSACRLLDLVFTKHERKAAGQRIDALVGGDLLGDALAETGPRWMGQPWLPWLR